MLAFNISFIEMFFLLFHCYNYCTGHFIQWSILCVWSNGLVGSDAFFPDIVVLFKFRAVFGKLSKRHWLSFGVNLPAHTGLVPISFIRCRIGISSCLLFWTVQILRSRWCKWRNKIWMEFKSAEIFQGDCLVDYMSLFPAGIIELWSHFTPIYINDW